MTTLLTQEQRIKIMAWLINDLYTSRGIKYEPDKIKNGDCDAKIKEVLNDD